MRRLLLAEIGERVLLADGAMGTELQRAGLEFGGCGEGWNLDHPERVERIHRAYVQAGSDCLLTNTFGASHIALARHGEADRVGPINRAAVAIARHAFGARDGFVLGDIGPFGGLMEPLGDVAREAVARAFREQARALVEAGVDAIIIETQTALDELEIAIGAAQEAGAPAVIGSIAFERALEADDVRTMMGVSPETAAEFMAERGVDVVGLNCGAGIDLGLAARIVRRYRASCGLPVMAQPNAGQPVLEHFEVRYRETPAAMARELPALLASGVAIVGGCCGSTPAHIKRFREILDGRELSERT